MSYSSRIPISLKSVPIPININPKKSLLFHDTIASTRVLLDVSLAGESLLAASMITANSCAVLPVSGMAEEEEVK